MSQEIRQLHKTYTLNFNRNRRKEFFLLVKQLWQLGRLTEEVFIFKNNKQCTSSGEASSINRSTWQNIYLYIYRFDLYPTLPRIQPLKLYIWMQKFTRISLVKTRRIASSVWMMVLQPLVEEKGFSKFLKLKP